MRDPSPEHVLISEFGTNFYEPADNVRSMYGLGGFTFSHLEWPKWAWPGGYEIHYYAADGGVLCADCANKELMRTIDPDDHQFCIGLADINYEDNHHLYCDHCNRKIEPAYAGEG